MADDRDQERPGEPGAHPHPPGWTEADTALEEMIEEEEEIVRTNRRLIIAALGLIGLIVAALVIGLLAMNRDIEAVARATPKDDSVSSASIQAGAVTGDKLAAGAVGTEQLAAGAVGTEQLADGAVTSAKIANGAIAEANLSDGAVTTAKLAVGAVGVDALARGAVTNPAIANDSVGNAKLRAGSVDGSKVVDNSLTGNDIDEAKLGKVPEAAKADNAAKLGGLAAAAFLKSVEIVSRQTEQNQQPTKALSVACPSGKVVIGGGARVDGVDAGVGLSISAPDGTNGWVTRAEEMRDPRGPWRLVVYAICAATG